MAPLQVHGADSLKQLSVVQVVVEQVESADLRSLTADAHAAQDLLTDLIAMPQGQVGGAERLENARNQLVSIRRRLYNVRSEAWVQPITDELTQLLGFDGPMPLKRLVVSGHIKDDVSDGVRVHTEAPIDRQTGHGQIRDGLSGHEVQVRCNHIAALRYVERLRHGASVVVVVVPAVPEVHSPSAAVRVSASAVSWSVDMPSARSVTQ